MKRITIGFSLLILCIFSAMVIYVAVSKDFIMPTSLNEQEGVAEDNPIWNKNMDDLAAYLESEGVIDASKYNELSSGVATVARKYSDVDLYWWDINALEENSDEYRSYVSLQKEGYIDLWNSGMLMYLEKHGPFGLGVSSYKGDINRLRKVFMKYCMEESSMEESSVEEESAVWDKTMDDLVTYLEKEGFINSADKVEISAIGFTSVAVNYHGIELYWWDLKNLDENSDEYKAYISLRDKGFIDLWGSGNVISPMQIGPFAMLTTHYNGEQKSLSDAFKRFGEMP